MSLTEKQIKARDKSIGLKELLIQALTEQIAARAGYSNHNEAELAINKLDITYTQKKFTLKNLSESLAQAFKDVFPSFVAIQSETDSKTFTLSLEAAKKFAGALKGEPAAVGRKSRPKDPDSDSGHGSAASSAASSPQSSPPRKTRGKAANSTAAVSMRTSARNILFDNATKMQGFLHSLKGEVNKPSWDTQGFTFFMRHVPRHIKELRDCLAKVNLASDLQDGQVSQWEIEIKREFDRVTAIIEQANKKHPFFRSKAVEAFYQRQTAEINKIKSSASSSQATRPHR